MEQNKLLVFGRLLTGYIPGAEATAAVTALAKRLRERNPDLIYLLDRAFAVALGMHIGADSWSSRVGRLWKALRLAGGHPDLPCCVASGDNHHT